MSNWAKPDELISYINIASILLAVIYRQAFEGFGIHAQFLDSDDNPEEAKRAIHPAPR